MKSSNAEQDEEIKGLAGIYRLFGYGLKEARIFALIGPLMYLIIMAVIVMIIGYGGVRVANGTMSTGSLVAFLLYLFQIIMSLLLLLRSLHSFKKFGERSINELSLFAWRKQIGYVSQKSAMMAGTIRANLCYGFENIDQIKDEKLWEVVRWHMLINLFQEFPNGLDTEVGERGELLSGGQRQRTAIARAFLRDPKILMMDEATASLDSQSEHVVQEALTKLMEGRTTFVIAHRLSTIVDADKIIFIEKGAVTAIGNHEELSHSHELYRRFAKQQLV